MGDDINILLKLLGNLEYKQLWDQSYLLEENFVFLWERIILQIITLKIIAIFVCKLHALLLQ